MFGSVTCVFCIWNVKYVTVYCMTVDIKKVFGIPAAAKFAYHERRDLILLGDNVFIKKLNARFCKKFGLSSLDMVSFLIK